MASTRNGAARPLIRLVLRATQPILSLLFRLRLPVFCLCFLVPLTAGAKTLYVSPAGSDATSYADNSQSAPWASIGRAAWGSTNRDSPNPAEAAQAGDTVQVAGGTYVFDGAIHDRFGVVYNPANSGTAQSYITFVCEDDCTLEAPNADSPVIGASGRDYVKWYADVSLGHSWIIQACGLMTGCGQNVVNTTPDTGPVVCVGATGCWVEGAEIDGGPPIDYVDNWNAFRLENASACTIRNNRAANFTRDPAFGNTNHNQSIVTMYGTQGSLFEHNYGRNAGSGVYFKDTGNTNPQLDNVIRFNRFEEVGEVIGFSITDENRNFIYQNVGTNSGFGLRIVGGGLSDDWIFNNTFHGMTAAFVAPSSLGGGGRAWNNICVDCDRIVSVDNTTMVDETVCDLEHNVYQTFTHFYSGPDGNQTFESYLSANPDQDQAAPASIVADPLFADAAGGDFRLCTGAGQPAPSCSEASPALDVGVDLLDLDGDGETGDAIPAGAFVTGDEIIGPGASPDPTGGAGPAGAGGGGGAPSAGAGADGGAGAQSGGASCEPPQSCSSDDGTADAGDGGCSCRMAAPERTSWPWLAAGLLLALRWCRRCPPRREPSECC